MLQQIFLKLLNMSIAAGYCAVFVIIIRLIIKKLPKSYSYVLWAIVFVRLMLPAVPESRWSLMPAEWLPGAEAVWELEGWQEAAEKPQNLQQAEKKPENLQEAMNVKREQEESDGIETWEKYYTDNNQGKENIQGTNVDTNTTKMQQNTAVNSPDSSQTSIKQKIALLDIVSLVWLLGSTVLLLYGLLSKILFEKRLKGAIQSAKGIYELEKLPTAFVTGLIKPRIYLPAGLPEEYRRYVLAHEQTHLQRGDIWVKYVTYFITSIHWFNPLVWISFYLMCRDMEMSCDERVLRTLGMEEKRAYSTALLAVASGRKVQLGMPIAFSESDAKSRIKNVLHYRKPTFWVAVVAVMVLVALAMGLLSDPETEGDTESGLTTESEGQAGAENTVEQSTENKAATAETQEEILAEFEQEVLFERQPIMANDVYDRSVLSEKLSHAFSLPFLFEDYEDVNEIDVSTFHAVLWDNIDIKYSKDTTYYFDGQKLMEEFCIMTGQDTEEFWAAHAKQGYNSGKQYHTIDGDDISAFVKVTGVERERDNTEVDIYYECWGMSGYHLWDGKVTMKIDGLYLKFAANERNVKDRMSTVTEKPISYIYRDIEETELVENFAFPMEEMQDVARKFIGNEEVYISASISERDEKYFYGRIDCHKLPYSQFCDLGVILIRYSIADGTVEALAEIKVDGATEIYGPKLYENKLYWSIGLGQEDSYQYDLETDQWSLIADEDIPADLDGEKEIRALDIDKGIVEVINKKSNRVEQQVDLADGFWYGYIDDNGYLMHRSAFRSGYGGKNIWIYNLQTGKSAKLFDEHNSGTRELGICNNTFYIFDDVYGDSKLELIHTENNLRVVYDLPDDISTSLYVSNEYMFWVEYNQYIKSLNINEAIEHVR